MFWKEQIFLPHLFRLIRFECVLEYVYLWTTSRFSYHNIKSQLANMYAAVRSKNLYAYL